MKGSKHSDSSIVSNENFSETLLAKQLGPRPGNVSQNEPKTTLLMTSVTKNLHPPTKKFFFECNLEGRSIWALEQLSSAIGGGARALVRQPKTAVV